MPQAAAHPLSIYLHLCFSNDCREYEPFILNGLPKLQLLCEYGYGEPAVKLLLLHLPKFILVCTIPSQHLIVNAHFVFQAHQIALIGHSMFTKVLSSLTCGVSWSASVCANYNTPINIFMPSSVHVTKQHF